VNSATKCRKNGEPMDGGRKHRLLGLYSVALARRGELANLLSARNEVGHLHMALTTCGSKLSGVAATENPLLCWQISMNWQGARSRLFSALSQAGRKSQRLADQHSGQRTREAIQRLQSGLAWDIKP